MARINRANQINLWGKAANQAVTRDPQRADLWFADFSGVTAALQKRVLGNQFGEFSMLPLRQFPQTIPDLAPQLVKSITFPETKMRPETFRRMSIPYQMPSWDEPLDPIRVQFIADLAQSSEVTGFSAAKMLTWWSYVARIGRGSRKDGAASSVLVLQENSAGGLEIPQYAFDFTVYMIRGMDAPVFGDSIALNQTVLNSTSGAAAGAWAANAAGGGAGSPPPFSAQSGFQASISNSMTISSIVRFNRAWVAGFKMSDLSYETPGLVLFDATLYAEAVNYDDNGLTTGWV